MTVLVKGPVDLAAGPFSCARTRPLSAQWREVGASVLERGWQGLSVGYDE